jgi:hypothetical protein
MLDERCKMRFQVLQGVESIIMHGDRGVNLCTAQRSMEWHCRVQQRGSGNAEEEECTVCKQKMDEEKNGQPGNEKAVWTWLAPKRNRDVWDEGRR